MTLDNSKQIISFRIRLFFITVLALVWLALAYVAKLIKFPLLGIEDGIWTLVVVAVWVIVAFYPMIFNYQFIFFSDDGESLVFRYFTAGIIGGKKNSVEIGKRSFAGFKTESRYLGLSKSIILFQHVGNGVAKYPTIHISALTRDQFRKLVKALSAYAPEA